MRTNLRYQKSLTVAVIFLFIGILIAQGILVPGVIASDDTSNDIMVLNSLENINLDDDAFHTSSKFFHIETWYFDAVFQNNFSMAFIITIVEKNNVGVVRIGFFLYNETTLLVQQRNNYPFRHCYASEEQPLIKIDNTTILTGTINTSGFWDYTVSFESGGQGVHLQFVNLMNGWKNDIRGGWWLVIPQLYVSGHILLNGENITVTGHGYHDHNWFYFYTPLIQKGWHFVNIPGDTIGITYAQVMKTRFNGEVLAFLNQKNQIPIRISSDDIFLNITEYLFDYGEWIPNNALLRINTSQVQADLTLQAINVHYVKLPFVKYWRYHLKITGFLTVDSLTEMIDTVQISELMKFF